KQRRLRLGMSPRLARLDVNNLIDDQYRNTISAPPSTPEYNKIFGDSNPAIESAKKEVQKKTDALKIITKPVEDAKQNVKTAQESLQQAQNALTQRTAELAMAQADLNAAKAAVPEGDGAAAQQQINTLRKNLDVAKQNVATAEAAYNSTTPGTPEQAAAKADLDAARKALATQQKLIAWWEDKLQGHLDAAKEIQELTAKVQAAQVAFNGAQKDVAVRQDAYNTNAAAHARVEAEHAASKKKAEEELKEAKDLLAAIKKSGVDMLLDQPNAGSQSVFSGSLLNARTPDRTNRLRLVGFPDFSAVTYSGADAAALIPVEAFQLGVNASDARISQVSVKVPSAESYSLSVDRLLDAVTDCPDGQRIRWLRDDLFQAAMFQAGLDLDGERASRSSDGTHPKNASSCCPQGEFYMRVISEVFYARALDIGVFSARSGGFRATATLPLIPAAGGADGTGGASVPAPPAFSGVPAGTATGAGSTLPGSTLASLGTTVEAPGGSVQLVSYSERSVGLRRLFHRPVAVGFRGVTLKIRVECRDGDRCSGRIVGVFSSAGNPSLE
ncbi:MAG: hypothetical protein KC996_11490, partial [Phycisphaerales bacterium]|nr:hypothetical protein [Phycisphaerales bacterium]